MKDTLKQDKSAKTTHGKGANKGTVLDPDCCTVPPPTDPPTT